MSTIAPEPREASLALHALFDAWRAAPPRLPPDVPHLPAAEARLAAGVPALTGEPLLDGRTLMETARAIARRLGGVEGYETAAAVADRLGDLDPGSLAEIALAGDWDAVAALAPRLDVDAYAVISLLDYAARPALRAGAAAVRPLVLAVHWVRGTCPACGAPPTLATVSGKEGERSLHCGRCGTGWPFPRLCCAGCGQRDHRQLGVLHGAGEGEYRWVQVCESCRVYLKTVATLDPPAGDGLLELDLATAALDFMAIEQGYRRG